MAGWEVSNVEEDYLFLELTSQSILLENTGSMLIIIVEFLLKFLGKVTFLVTWDKIDWFNCKLNFLELFDV